MMLNVPGWSKANIEIIETFLSGYHALDEHQKKEFSDLVDPVVYASLQSLIRLSVTPDFPVNPKEEIFNLCAIIGNGAAVNQAGFLSDFFQSELMKVVKTLQDANLFTTDNFAAVMARPDLVFLGGALNTLHRCRLLSLDHFMWVMQNISVSPSPIMASQSFGSMLRILERFTMLTPGNFKALKPLNSFLNASRALALLAMHQLLTPLFKQDYFNIVVKENRVDELLFLYQFFIRQGSAQKLRANILAVLRSNQIKDVSRLVQIMPGARFLNQEHIDQLFNPRQTDLILTCCMALASINTALLSEPLFKKILTWSSSHSNLLGAYMGLGSFRQALEFLRPAGLLIGDRAEQNFLKFLD